MARTQEAMKKYASQGWRDGSASFRNPKLNSKQPHDGPQPSTMGSGVLGYAGTQSKALYTCIT